MATEKKALYGAGGDVSLRLPLLAEAGTGRWNGASEAGPVQSGGVQTGSPTQGDRGAMEDRRAGQEL